ncbi:NAD(P)H-dependent oxidoreductase [Nanchangia anserum]|uniref:NAD(P)H-dependent oxidoreductase n=1 Tax=Nanchangia anserum TaxID=2692125 RepID=A0A8I0GCB0_9ACTO|nr:NAD(P)H-dependent oxidoreductase [Nanchangia anserum]MBD3689381.1 NAD(P)H-dependent oxidoreductase [Nanchangia anserum]QOX81587.1 NAD(P)H-dependent oxidoreductase [Nanchangia anserum]
MRTVVCVFHPDLTDGSRVNAALASAASTAADVEVRDMYGLYPDGKIDVKAEQAVLESADRIVLQFPFYWYSSPALLKEWEDRVLEYGWAYGSTGTALHGKELLVAVSPGAQASQYQRDGGYSYTVTELLRPLQATSNLIGARYLRPFVTAGSMSLSDTELAQIAADYAAALTAPREQLGLFD